MRDIALVVLLGLTAHTCLDHAAAAAVAEQDAWRARAQALSATEAANTAAAAATNAEWASLMATADRDAACSCEWSLVQADPMFPKFKDQVAINCRGGDECPLRWAWTADVPPHQGEP